WYFAASCALFAYEYCLTIRREIVDIWMEKRTLSSIVTSRWVFYVNIIRWAANSTSPGRAMDYSQLGITNHSCNHFAIVEWIQALVIALSAETVLAIRVYALTMRNKWLASLLGFIMISQCTIVFYVMAQPMKNTALSVPELPMDSFHVCILYSDAHIESAYLATSIAFDCCVFAVTLWATLRGRFSQDGIDSTIRRDGAIYFCVILSGNVIWMLMSLFARPGLKLMNAQYVFPPSHISPTDAVLDRPSMMWVKAPQILKFANIKTPGAL
ncbi:hypothetical protein BD779DRAFT_1447942, partial [Infundibulicybe gibba]